MKKAHLFFLPIFLIALSSCNKVEFSETPELKPITTSANACKNLVIFIGDGMGENHIKAGEIVSNTKFDFTSWNQTYSDTFSYNSFADENVELTDSAAGGTAIATGVTTINGRVGKDAEGNDLATILDYASSLGKSTGVISTDTITGATPADFSGHALNRSSTDDIISTQITSNINLFIGQESGDVENRKKDIKKGGYSFYSLGDSLENLNRNKKVWIQYAFEENGGENFLKDATSTAINYLSNNENGYVLVIEQAHIDKFSHNHNFIEAVKAVNSLNDTIEYVKSTNDSTGIIITADHETGGLSISDEPIYAGEYNNAYYQYLTGSHTNTYVPVYVNGFDVNFEEFSMFKSNDLVKNKDIFDIALYAITGQK